MNVAIIGYSQSGRSTLYRAAAGGLAKGDVTAAPVPDPRFDRIVAQVQPKKATPATVTLHDDLDGISGSGKAFSQRFLDAARRSDLLLHVVRAFDSPISPFHADIDARRDMENVEVELVLADLQIVESRLEKLQKSLGARNPGSAEYNEKVLLEKVRGPLEEGVAMRQMDLDEAEQAIARNYQFLSIKPLVVAFNVPEGEAAAPCEAVAKCLESQRAKGIPAFAVCASLEEEIAQLDEADRAEFLSSLGLSEPASDKVVRAAYDAMQLITFFTAGENETKAWTVRRGASALKAAATIHTDIAKGFIRAEVTHYDDYDAAGSMDAAHKAGKMTLEGKDYVVQDGDLLNIRNKS